MDAAIIRSHLNQAEEHVALGEAHIVKQRQLVVDLIAAGSPETAVGQKLLATFEELQATHVADRDHLRQELGAD